MINIINNLASFFKVNNDGTKTCLNSGKFIKSVYENICVLNLFLFSGNSSFNTTYIHRNILGSEFSSIELPYSVPQLECYRNVVNYFMQDGPLTKEDILNDFEKEGNFRFLKYPIFLDDKGLINLESNKIIIERKHLDNLIHKDYKIEKIKIIDLNKDNLEKLLINTYHGNFISDNFTNINKKTVLEGPLCFFEGHDIRFELYLALKNNFLEKNKSNIFIMIKKKKIYLKNLKEKNIVKEYANDKDESSYESLLRYLLCIHFGVNPNEEFESYNSYYTDYVGFSDGKSIFFH